MLVLTGRGCGDLWATSLPRCTWARCAITQPPPSPAGHVGGAHLAAKSAPQGPGGMARVPGELWGGAPGRNPPCCLSPHVQTRGHTCSVASSLSKCWLREGQGHHHPPLRAHSLAGEADRSTEASQRRSQCPNRSGHSALSQRRSTLTLPGKGRKGLWGWDVWEKPRPSKGRQWGTEAAKGT